MLSPEQLEEFTACAHKNNLDVVVEVHTHEELQKIAGLDTNVIIGVNNRNLKDFSTNVGHAIEIINTMDPHRTIIAESAFSTPADYALYQDKIDAALIGTALLISDDPSATLISFTSHARRS